MRNQQHQFGISRRKILAGIGAIGIASAGAGLGTTAFFSDREDFTDNVLAAGELDLKVDWQQTYTGPLGTVPVNAYPDPDGDGQQSFHGVTYGGPDADIDASVARLPGVCCDCDQGEYLVVLDGQSWCIEPVRAGKSVVDFYAYDDPSDSSLNVDVPREDTSFLFLYEEPDGDRYLVFVHDVSTDSDGGFADVQIYGFGSEPTWVVKDDEDKSTGTGSQDAYSVSSDAATADWVWSAQRTDGGAVGPIGDEVTITIDAQFGDDAQDAGETGWGSPMNAIDHLVALSGGNGTLGPGGSTEEIELISEGDGLDIVGPLLITSGCSVGSVDDLPVSVFDAPNRAEEYGGPLTGQTSLVELTDVKPGDSGEITFSLHLCDNPGYVWMDFLNLEESGGETPEPEESELAEEETDAGELAEHVEVRLWYDDDCDNRFDAEEREIFSGTLTELFTEAGTPFESDAAHEGAVVGRRVPLDGDSATPGRDCMPGFGVGRCVGFEWVLPPAVGNVIQGDSLSFDVGFYAEQCRHNEAPAPGGFEVSDVAAIGPEEDDFSGVQFDLLSRYAEDVRIERLTIDPPAGVGLLSDLRGGTDYDAPFEFNSDVLIDADQDGWVDGGGGRFVLPGTIDLTADGFNDGADRPAIVVGGGTATVYLYAFRRGGGDTTLVDVRGRQIEVTFEVVVLGSGKRESVPVVVNVPGSA